MNKKLIIIIIAAILILSLIGVLLFVAVKKQNQAKLPVVAMPQAKKVLDEAVIAPVASFDNNAIWYFNSVGRLFRVNIDGSGLTEFPLPALADGKLRRALWPKTGSDFIAITGLGANEVKTYYNSTQKIYITLPSNIQSLDWLPDSLRVVYIWKSSDNVHQQLVMANADGTGFKTIKDVFWPDLKVVASPDGKTVLLWRSSVQGDINKIYAANLQTGQIDTVVAQGKNTAADWLPVGNRFIFAQSSITAYPRLYLYDFTNQQAVDLNLNTTLDKVTFDKNGLALYAAVPKKDNSGDTFIKVDLKNFKQEIYFEPSQNIHASGLVMVGNTLYFSNTQDQKFYTIVK